MFLLRSSFLLAFAAAASISLSVSPTSFYCGNSVTLSWSSSGATMPLKLYMRGSSSSVLFAETGALGSSGSMAWTPSNCGASGSYYMYLWDNAYWTSYSSNVDVTVLAPTLSISTVAPSTFYGGDSIVVSWSTGGPSSGPYTIAIVGWTAYNTNAWTWSGCAITTSGSSGGSYAVSTSLVSSGSYYIVVKSNSDVMSTGSVVTVLAPSLTISSVSPTSFYGGDSIVVSWSTRGLSSSPYSIAIVGSTAYTANSWTWSGSAITTSGSSGGSYAISTSLVSSGRYYIVVKDSSGVTSIGSAVTVFSPRHITISSVSPSSFYGGDSIVVSWSTSGTSSPYTIAIVGFTAYTANSWTWSGSAITTSGSSGGSYAISTSLVSSGSYYIVVKDSSSVTSTGFAVTVLNTPFISLSMSTPTIYTLGAATANVNLRRSISAADLYVCHTLCSLYNPNPWDNIKVATGSLTAGSRTWEFAVPLSAATFGSYYVYICEGSLCSGNAELEVRAPPPNPVATFEPEAAVRPLVWSAFAYVDGTLFNGALPAQVCAPALRSLLRVGDPVSFTVLKTPGAYGYLLKNSDGLVVLAFSGTDSILDLVADAASVLPLPYFGCQGCNVGAGFLIYFNLLAPQLSAALRQLIPTAAKGSTPIVVTGHIARAPLTVAKYPPRPYPRSLLAVGGVRAEGV